MVDYIIIIAPVMISLMVYFVRLESRITKILTDLCWMKEALTEGKQSH